MKHRDLDIIGKIRDYFRTQPIDKAWLFGSFSRGEETLKSDVDILVEFSAGTSIGMKYFRIIDELERLCSRKIDLAESKMLDPRVRDNVNAEKILIYERTGQR